MPDLRGRMDDEARRVRAGDDALESVVRRADRRRVARRATGTFLALAVAAGGVGLAYATFRPGNGARPSGGPTAEPTSSARAPIPEGIHLVVLDAAPALEELPLVSYLEHFLNPELQRYRILGATETEGSEVTVLMYQPGYEDEASALRDDFFPGADVRPDHEASDAPLRIVIGEDFEARHGAHVRNLATTYDFMWARVRGQTERVEPLLWASAADQFAAHEGGMDLYAYTQRATFEILVVSRNDAQTRIHVRIRQPNEDGYAEAFETLTVGDVDGDGAPEVLSAERNR